MRRRARGSRRKTPLRDCRRNRKVPLSSRVGHLVGCRGSRKHARSSHKAAPQRVRGPARKSSEVLLLMAKLASPRAAIRLGVIGAGLAFDKLHWPVLQKMPGRFRVTAVASRTRERSTTVAQTVGGARVYDRYCELLQDPEIDAVLV